MFTACLVWTVSHFVFPCLFIVQVSVEEWILECGLAVCAWENLWTVWAKHLKHVPMPRYSWKPLVPPIQSYRFQRMGIVGSGEAVLEAPTWKSWFPVAGAWRCWWASRWQTCLNRPGPELERRQRPYTNLPRRTSEVSQDFPAQFGAFLVLFLLICLHLFLFLVSPVSYRYPFYSFTIFCTSSFSFSLSSFSISFQFSNFLLPVCFLF